MSYDIFISYRWIDEAAYETGEPGKVAAIKDVLEKELEPRLGRKPEIFLDIKKARNQEVLQSLRGALESSRLFLAMVTRSMGNPASWAQWEATHFSNSANLWGGLPADRIFKAVLVPVARESELEELRDHTPYPLYGVYSVDDLRNPAHAAGREFLRLVGDLEEKLKNTVDPPDGERRVYVTASEYGEKRKRLMRGLREQMGCRTVAETPWPGFTPAALEEQIGTRLEASEASVHLMGPHDWEAQVPGVELDKALQVAGRKDKKGFRIFVWEDPKSPKTGAGELRKRLSNARAANNYDGMDWENALSNVYGELKSQPAAICPPIPVPPGPYNCRIFVVCMESDRLVALAVHNKLLERRVWAGFRPQSNAFWRRISIRDTPLPADARILDRFRRFYSECNGSVVLYGDAPENWAYDRCDEIRDYLGDGFDQKVCAVCVAPPAEDQKDQTFKDPDFTNYRLSEIEEYLDRLPCARAQGQ